MKALDRNEKLGAELITRCDEISIYYRALFDLLVPSANKFVIFADYRTGSALLSNLLNCHPEVKCDGEIFGRYLKCIISKKVLFPHLYMKGLHLKSSANTYSCNLKLDEIIKILSIFHGSPRYFIQKLYRKG